MIGCPIEIGQTIPIDICLGLSLVVVVKVLHEPHQLLTKLAADEKTLVVFSTSCVPRASRERGRERESEKETERETKRRSMRERGTETETGWEGT